MTVTVAINGLGRIGRALARILAAGVPGVRLAAVNSLEEAATAAHLLRYDSVYGPCPDPVSLGQEGLEIGCQRGVRFFREPDPERLPWQDLGIDVVIESTGHFTGPGMAAAHLRAGAKKVLISAAADAPDITLCMGVNERKYDPKRHHVVSASSCTTNCVAPVLKVVDEHCGIRTCMVTFLHSYTNGQRLVDGPASDPRRARSIHGNLIPTTTSAVHQVPKVLPRLAGRIDGLAVRLPTPNTHLADLVAVIHQRADRDGLLDTLATAAAGPLRGILALTDGPRVSRDFTGATASSIVDTATLAVHGHTVKMLVWHDNEHAYCRRLLDLLRHIAHN